MKVTSGGSNLPLNLELPQVRPAWLHLCTSLVPPRAERQNPPGQHKCCTILSWRKIFCSSIFFHLANRRRCAWKKQVTLCSWDLNRHVPSSFQSLRRDLTCSSSGQHFDSFTHDFGFCFHSIFSKKRTPKLRKYIIPISIPRRKEGYKMKTQYFYFHKLSAEQLYLFDPLKTLRNNYKFSPDIFLFPTGVLHLRR